MVLRLLLIFLSLLICNNVYAVNYCDDENAEHAYLWAGGSGDDEIGSVDLDSSGSSPTATSGSACPDPDGSDCYEFDGTDDWIGSTQGTTPDLAHTFTFCVFIDADDPASDFAVHMGRIATGFGAEYWAVGGQNTNVGVWSRHTTYYDADGTTEIQDVPGLACSQHIAGDLLGFWEGSQEAQDSNASDDNPDSSAYSEYALTVGAQRRNSPSAGAFFDGHIGHVIIFDDAATELEMTDMADNGFGCSAGGGDVDVQKSSTFIFAKK